MKEVKISALSPQHSPTHLSASGIVSSLIPRRTFSSGPFKTGQFGMIRHELDSTNPGGHLPHLLLKSSLKAHGNGLWSARIIGPPTALIL
ncbi:hypothetical protein AVEN_198468-1 [Araneus ventricosus]|uniref:Uncharacterized protein n=1 Tax=Araneus ventricosus TaxID=182803 RepID=A0A4Y2ERZ1_ARAVE|nr:hypothetical protein AVEN_198468-1 [Araneus ventricosus]